MIEPGILAHQCAQPRRSHRQPDQDEADDRTDPEAREAGDHQSRSPQYDEGIAEALWIDRAGHDRSSPQMRRISSDKHAKPENDAVKRHGADGGTRSEEHTSELQSLMRISYAVFCLKKKPNNQRLNT